MTHMGLIWWPKHTTTSQCGDGGGATRATQTTAETTTGSSRHRSGDCGCLMKLMRKLKRRSRMLCAASRSASTFRCHYDPLSYALNFDTSGCGSMLDDNYDHFHAFSSRFVATPSRPPPSLVAVATSH
uniref:Uncharacterized protein n=1 Tax=Nelumbo nucifera TaxID=4432 RepID=A0A822ZK15_NELNU|nr:TPA_asm: hypothetical protein HUJ06_002171 [Nelumbo nucifera]